MSEPLKFEEVLVSIDGYVVEPEKQVNIVGTRPLDDVVGEVLRSRNLKLPKPEICKDRERLYVYLAKKSRDGSYGWRPNAEIVKSELVIGRALENGTGRIGMHTSYINPELGRMDGFSILNCPPDIESVGVSASGKREGVPLCSLIGLDYEIDRNNGSYKAEAFVHPIFYEEGSTIRYIDPSINTSDDPKWNNPRFVYDIDLEEFASRCSLVKCVRNFDIFGIPIGPDVKKHLIRSKKKVESLVRKDLTIEDIKQETKRIAELYLKSLNM